MTPNPMSPSVNLDELMVVLPECVTVPLGHLSEDMVATLERRGFDDAPITDGGGILGIISTRELRRRLSEGLPLTADGYRPLGTESVILTDGSEAVSADL